MRVTQTFASALAMMSLEETGGACLTLISFSGFSCFAGSRFFDGFWSDFFVLTGLGIWERGEILVTGSHRSPITNSWTQTSSSLEPTFRLPSSLRPSLISSNTVCGSLLSKRVSEGGIQDYPCRSKRPLWRRSRHPYRRRDCYLGRPPFRIRR